MAATVAGRAITVAAVRRRAAGLRAGPLRGRLPPDGAAEVRRFERWVAQELVAEAVIAHEAAASGVRASGREAAQALFERVTADVEVSEGQVRACHAADPGRWSAPERRRVRHILLAGQAAARAVTVAIAAGEDMAQLAGRLSADVGTRGRGGDLGEIRRGELTGPFEDAVFSAAAGQVVGPVRTEFGWHVARVEAVTPAAGIPYPQARAALRAELLAAARQRAFDHWLAGRTAELARLAPDWLHPGDPRGGDPIHRH